MDEHSVIGKRTPRINGLAKATAEAVFATDNYLPGMLLVKVLGSPHPQTRIFSIDIEKAKELIGVRVVMSRRSGRSTRKRLELIRTGGSRSATSLDGGR